MYSRQILRSAVRLFIALSIFLCQACSDLVFLLNSSTTQTIPAHHFQFRDGAQAIYFSFDKSLQRGVVTDASGHLETYLFVIAGSGCTSMQYFLPQYFRGLEGESGPVRIFILQKRHIEEHSWGRIFGCGEEFIKADHPGRWIADQTEFINAQLAIAHIGAKSPKRIVLVGISEGGDIVPILAQRIVGITRAVIIGNGGMNPLDAYRLQAKKHGFADALDALDVLNQAPPSDPDAPAHNIAGRTWRYWFELSQLQQTDNLLRLSIPILMTMGDADQSVPIESAWHIRDRFSLRGKANLSLIVYPDADHALQVGGVSRLPDFWHAVEMSMEK